MKRFLPAALALLVFIPAANAAEAQHMRSLSVQGSGQATARPDMASARAGIESRAVSPEKALAANTKVMNAIMTAIKRHGIAERDFETTSFDISPIYAQPGTRGGTPTIEAYQVSNQVIVRVRDLAKLGGLLSSLVEAGANRLNGVSFDIAEPAPLMETARKAAVADARKRAELYAAAAGVKITKVLSIAENGSNAPAPMVLRTVKAASEAVPIAAGEQSISASVSVVYEIE